MYAKYQITLTVADNGVLIEAQSNRGDECNRIANEDADVEAVIMDMIAEMDYDGADADECDGTGCEACDGEGCE